MIAGGPLGSIAGADNSSPDESASLGHHALGLRVETGGHEPSRGRPRAEMAAGLPAQTCARTGARLDP
jgi:hypothetical protein